MRLGSVLPSPEPLEASLVLVIASLVALVAGPLLVLSTGANRGVARALDGFVLVTIGALVVLELLPHALESLGVLGLLPLGLGLFLPTLIEGPLHRMRGGVVAVWVAVIGLAVHALMDGAALAVGAHGGQTLALAVVLHRLPVGLLIWLVLRPRRGARVAWLLLGVVALATVGGFIGGEHLLHALPEQAVAVFTAVVAGSLLHVVLHEVGGDGELAHHHGSPHVHFDDHDHDHDKMPSTSRSDGDAPPKVSCCGGGAPPKVSCCGGGAPPKVSCCGGDAPPKVSCCGPEPKSLDAASLNLRGWPSGLGGLLGLATIIWMHVGGDGHEHGAADAAEALWGLLIDTAPALVFAFVGAGLIKAVLSPDIARWLGRGAPTAQALRGVAVGLPLPVCSCGVLPLYEALIKARVPAVAALAFLVATPELGLDAVLLTLPLMGPEVTVVRLVAAAVVALGVALFVGGRIQKAVNAAQPAEVTTEVAPALPFATRLKAGMRYALGELVDEILPWVLAGLIIAALASTVLDLSMLTRLSPWLQVPLAASLGIPLYICATGATPLAAVLLYKGLSPGAALAFLLTGPATNATTFGVLKRLHGRHVAVLFGVSVFVAAVGSGYVTDAVLTDTLRVAPAFEHHHHVAWWQWAGLAALVVLGTASLLRQGARKMVERVLGDGHRH